MPEVYIGVIANLFDKNEVYVTELTYGRNSVIDKFYYKRVCQ